MKILVKSDVFDICNRIKNFDSSYRIVYNNVNCQYQIYSTKLGLSIELISGQPLSYICTLPYKELDERTVRYLYSTSIENLEDIIKQIDANNLKLEKQNQQNLKMQSLNMIESKLRQLT